MERDACQRERAEKSSKPGKAYKKLHSSRLLIIIFKMAKIKNPYRNRHQRCHLAAFRLDSSSGAAKCKSFAVDAVAIGGVILVVVVDAALRETSRKHHRSSGFFFGFSI